MFLSLKNPTSFSNIITLGISSEKYNVLLQHQNRKRTAVFKPNPTICLNYSVTELILNNNKLGILMQSYIIIRNMNVTDIAEKSTT